MKRQKGKTMFWARVEEKVSEISAARVWPE